MCYNELIRRNNMISYNKLWKLLIDKGLTKTQFRELVGISTATLAKLSKNETVTTDTLDNICKKLQCDISDISEYKEM